jgi:hypothetical protein
MRIFGMGLRWALLLVVLGSLMVSQSACSSNACFEYFTQLKTNCQLNGTTEGDKIDRFLQNEFKACQIAICERTALTDIDCSNPDTHVPGGIDGRFYTCN